MSDFTLDTRQFSEALRFVQKATKKDAVTLLNRAALHAIIGGKGVRGAMQRTPKADKAKIRGLDDKLLAGAVAKKLRAKGIKAESREDFAKRVRAERSRRARAAGYTAFAGWSNAAKALGGKGVRGVQSGFERSKAAKGFGTKAKERDLASVIANTAPVAEKIGAAALQAAVNDVARDLVEYGTRKLQQTLKKASG